MAGKPTKKSDAPWQQRGLCSQLNPQEADNIFFPGPGGKSLKAKIFCLGCPVQAECLRDALVTGSVGFTSGTTEPERKSMAEMLGLLPVSVDEFLPFSTRPSAVGRRPPQKKRDLNPLNDPLHGVYGPTEDEEKEFLNIG